MRPFAPLALLVVALAGCGVPDTAIPAAEEPPKKVEEPPKKDSPTPKAAEQDPAKLGLKIIDTKVGTGAVAEDGDTLTMRYTGRLKSNGEEFDSNMKPDGKPFTFPLGGGQVIKGWDIGVKGMKVGGKRTLDIPSNLGYGAQGGGAKIPPNSDLVFDIELMEVQKAGDANTVLREIVKPGAGPEAKAGDSVTITYEMSLPDGTLVDDNGGRPATLKIGSKAVTIPGLNVALTGMRKGEVVRATIPPALGMMPTGPDGKVPPGSTLKMDITLLKIG